jgi:signal transduction histidine kinase
MRWRVIALVVIPTVAALGLGALRIEAAQSTSVAAGRIEQLAVIGGDITTLAEAIEDERDLTAGYVATRLAGMTPQSAAVFRQLQRQYAVTGARVAAVEGMAGQIGPGYPAVARSDLSAVLSSLSALTELRGLAHTEMSSLPLITHYSNVIATLLEFDNDIGAGSSSAQLAQTVTSLTTLAQMEEQASQQRAILYASLLAGAFEPGALNALTSAQSSQASDLATFQKVAASLPAFVPGTGLSPSLMQAQQLNDIVESPAIDAATATEEDAIISGQDGQLLAGSSPQAWYTDMSVTLSTMRSVENDEVGSITAQAGSLQQGAMNSRLLTAVGVLALLVLVLIASVVMARSLIIPLRRLRADALDVAGRRLPDMVRRLSESQGGEEVLQIEPIGITSTDEIGEVARAFDQVHSEAVRLAGDEALLRANLNAMFVNLSRRSQTMIERQLGIIDALEQSEQDPDRLSSLFRLDHLATRMRRNSENLLVLAGHEDLRKWSQAVPLVDVLRAAISEIEQYERITLNVQPGIAIAGRAASDVAHLAAELLENATAFSPEDTQVLLTGQPMSSGGVLIEITDEGLGISGQDLEYANWRLENPPVIDVAVSRRMGLFVVGRLAARHGIRVRLRHSPRSGLSALVWLPDPITEPELESSPAMPRKRRVGASGVRTAAPLFTRKAAIPVPAQPALAEQAPAHPAPAESLPAEPVPAESLLTESLPAEPVPAGVATSGPLAPVPRLPIYDSVESDWFRHNGKPILDGGRPAAGSWTSPADEGFRAAQAAATPIEGGATSAGLPKRVPRANLIPGAVSESPVGRPRRPADQVRSRFADLQRGARQARSDAPWNYGAEEGERDRQ